MKLSGTGLLLILLLCAGCQPPHKSPSSPPIQNVQPQARQAIPSQVIPGGPIAVIDGRGKPFLTIIKGTSKYEVSSPQGELGSLKLESGKLHFLDSKGRKIGSIKKSGSDFKLEDSNGKKLFKLSSKEGVFHLKDSDSKTLLKIKSRDYGFKVDDNNGKSIAKIKIKGSSMRVEDESGRVLYGVSGIGHPEAAGVLLERKLSPIQKAAFLVAFNQL